MCSKPQSPGRFGGGKNEFENEFVFGIAAHAPPVLITCTIHNVRAYYG